MWMIRKVCGRGRTGAVRRKREPSCRQFEGRVIKGCSKGPLFEEAVLLH
jgi:hypothetical protein